ncbi:MAG: hypothetical protein IPP29_04880 [Bacteroidetes bacterium]|nr:hypothetical protein [Bacteroidota bacterium]
MKIYRKVISSFFCIAALMAAMSFIPNAEKNKKGTLIINFENYVGDNLLQLDSGKYENELGQEYTISKFRYYLGNIRLKNIAGKEFIIDKYFLIDEEDKESKRIMLSDVAPGEYASISFIVGVDSARNCSGIQTGALDPAKGMFWAWNTGYIFLKLEGHAPASKSPGHIFEYHIGGFKEPVNCIKNIKLTFDNLHIENNGAAVLKIKADAAQILKSPFTVDFASLSSVVDVHHAADIANNYADMFSVLK